MKATEAIHMGTRIHAVRVVFGGQVSFRVVECDARFLDGVIATHLAAHTMARVWPQDGPPNFGQIAGSVAFNLRRTPADLDETAAIFAEIVAALRAIEAEL